MMRRWGQVTEKPELQPVASGEELLALRAEVDNVHVSEDIQAYILELVRATREMPKAAKPEDRLLSYGASPRASISLYQASRALAWLRGMDHVSPAIVKDIFFDAMRHRVGLSYEAEAEEITADQVLLKILDKTAIPSRAGMI
jgi:MoxR-like ATPase